MDMVRERFVSLGERNGAQEGLTRVWLGLHGLLEGSFFRSMIMIILLLI